MNLSFLIIYGGLLTNSFALSCYMPNKEAPCWLAAEPATIGFVFITTVRCKTVTMFVTVSKIDV